MSHAPSPLFAAAIAAAIAALLAASPSHARTQDPDAQTGPTLLSAPTSSSAPAGDSAEAPATPDAAPSAQSETPSASETTGASETPETSKTVDPDAMADDLNSRQQLQQSFTLKRTIDGEVVESDKRTVVFDRDKPFRETEAGRTTREELRAAFDGETLTRPEAYEEAKLDFTVADVNRDGQMTADEFAALVASWRTSKARTADAPTKEIARQRQYAAFLAEINPDAAKIQTEAYAREKFAFLAGAEASVSRDDYIREYLLDFDSMDEDNNMRLEGNELLKFRALNRGESISM